jgi:hypothetical protein
MRRALFLLLPLFFACSALARELPDHRQGYITGINSPTSFTVDGQSVLCDAATKLGVVEPNKTTYNPATTADLLLGEHVEIEGHRKNGQYIADNVLVARPPQQDRTVVGAVLATEPAQLNAADGFFLDGRHMKTASGAHFDFDAIPAGVWVDYHATRKANGTWLLTQASFKTNSTGADEMDYRRKAEERLTPPDYAAHSNGRSKYVVGHSTLDANTAAHERLQRIGAKLTAAYQRDLPASDPNKIEFKFFVEQKGTLGAAWDDGSIFIPKKMMDRFANDDSLLAAILAYHMADAQQKQNFRASARRKTEERVALATAALGLVPGLGLASIVMNATSITASYYEGQFFNAPEMLTFGQDCRLGMHAMQLAGYDPKQLPIALIDVAFPPKKMDKVQDTTPAYYAVAMREVRENYSVAQ